MPETPNTGLMSLRELFQASNQVGRERRGEETEEPRPWETDWNARRLVRRTPVPAAVEQTEPSPRDEYMQEVERQERLEEGIVLRTPPVFENGIYSSTTMPHQEFLEANDRTVDELEEDVGDSDETPNMEWTSDIEARPRGRFIFPEVVASGRAGARVNPTPNNDLEDNEMRTVGSIVGREPDVSSVINHPRILGLNRVGVEIEVEQFTNRHQRLRYWNMVSDGSLRNNGQEFTFRGALGGKDAFDAISEIDTLLYQSKPDLNIRCSTHVHVDVRDMTVPQLKKMILAYAFYESFLFAQSGRHRMKSNFCMPLCIAEGLTHVLMDYWQYNDGHFVYQVTDRWDKYSAINLIPMRSYGSVEFRIAEGKSKSGQLLRLVNRFLALKEVAMANDDKDDRQFLDFLRETDYRTIFRKGVRNQVVFTEEDFKTGWVIANDIATLGKMR